MNPKNVAPAVVAAVLYLLFDTPTAYAWGPGVHLSLGGQVLQQAAWLPAAVGALLTRYAVDYLYGNLAADVVFAKRLSKVKQFCHHWSTGFTLLDRAADDRGRAFAYGYLSHLAADTVAHGKYVPRQIAVSRSTVNFGHVYWEMRADVTVGPEVWARVDRVMAEGHRADHGLLAELLKATFLPYSTNRQLFQSINRVAGHTQWRRTMAWWERCSRHPLPKDVLDGYFGECLDRTMCLLSSLQRSPLLHEDPNGTAALAYLRAHRREIRRLKRRGLPALHRINEAAASYAPTAWKPETLPVAG
ncbi:MAG: zinc dependent phospholipase C family protein [bacterium]|nr:zinc dependent phospholipase C family protein [bacterium]